MEILYINSKSICSDQSCSQLIAFHEWRYHTPCLPSFSHHYIFSLIFISPCERMDRHKPQNRCFPDLCVPGMLCRCLYFSVHFSSDLFSHPEASCAPSLPEKYGKLFSGKISLHPDRNRNYRSLQTDPEAYASSGLDVFPESLRSHRRCLHPSDHRCQSLWNF